ncbi:MAG: glycosyltransferase [Betaproteobacteria bacterium]|nr:glycosyltransferase [Betaproteobacteria bacterium]
MPTESGTRIAVLIPCYNEEVAIGAVIAAFKNSWPGAALDKTLRPDR